MKKLLKEIIRRRWVAYYLFAVVGFGLCCMYGSQSSYRHETQVMNEYPMGGSTGSRSASDTGVGANGAAAGLGVFAGLCLIAAEMARRNP